MIFANHAHTFPKECRPDGSVEALKKYMDEVGLDKCVAFASFTFYLKKNGLSYNPNLRLRDEIRDCPDLVGFGTLDFERDDIADQVDEIASLGFKGVKIHPQAQKLAIDGEKAFRAYEACEKAGLFVSFHSGVHWDRLKNNHVILFDEVAWNFPNLRFSMEHIGGYSFFNEALAVMVNNSRAGLQPRVYAGWTTISGSTGAWSISDDRLYALLAQTGAQRSVFGLDFPYQSAEYNRAAIARIRGLDIPEEDKAAILGGNLAQALGVPLD